MSFVLMEDLKRPTAKRVTVIASFRIFRPVLKIANFTFRSGRFLLQKTVWVFTGKQHAQPNVADLHDPEFVQLK